MHANSLMENKWIPYVLIFSLAVAQYANTRNHDFAWDDAIVLTENSRVQKGWSDIPELFENIKSSKTENRYGYRPISLLSFATDVQFFGLDSKASHRISILLYSILCLIVFLFLQQIFPEHKWQNFLATLLFVVHPLHTEVVANIKSRDEILAMIFGLLAMLFYLKATKKSSVLNYGLFLILLVVAFLSKENAVVFSGVALLLTWYKLSDTAELMEWVKRILPLAISLCLLVGIRLFAYSDNFFQNTDRELYEKGIFIQDGFVGNPIFSLESDFVLKWLNIIYIGAFHLYKFIVPFPLVHDYGYNYLQLVDLTDYQTYLSLIVAVVMVLITVITIRKRSIVGFGLGFFIITASVYLHIVELAPDIFGERFVFVSSLGLCVAAVGLTFKVIKSNRLRPVVFVFWLSVSVVFFSVGWNRNKAWKDNKTLLQTDLVILKDGARLNYNYALYLHRTYYQLPEEEKASMQDSILKYYNRTIEITDRLLPAYLDLGGAYMEFGRPEKARNIFVETIAKYGHLSAPYVQMAKYHMSSKEFSEAIPYLEKAIEYGSKNSDYHYLLAICQFNEGQHQQAIATLDVGEKLDVSDGPYLALMVRLHLRMNEVDKARRVLRRGLTQFPGDASLLEMKERVDARSAQ